ncbi:MAG: hypothetical protein LBD41_01665, partial [Clostridiales Family XIII bacterium]|nr:hypothetical protein [Clostridiales Family XIII bacterium]
MVLSKLKTQGFDKTMNWHVSMWQKYKIRPGGKAKNKSDCKTNYCVFNEPHKDYLYTDDWVKFLV